MNTLLTLLNPRAASGEIRKRELQEWAKGGRLVPRPVRLREPAKET